MTPSRKPASCRRRFGGDPSKAIPPVYVSEEALRQRFAQGDYLTRAANGEFGCCLKDEKTPSSGDEPPGTRSLMASYVNDGMQPHLGYVTATRFMREMMAPPKLPFTPDGLVQLTMTRAAVDPLPPVIQDLYGFRWSGLNHALVRLGSALIMAGAGRNVSYDKLVAELRAQTDEHAFGRAAKTLRATRKDG